MTVNEVLKGKILNNVFIKESNKPIKLLSKEGAIRLFGNKKVKFQSLCECYEITLYI